MIPLAETLISGDWIIGIVIAIITAVGGVWLKSSSEERGARCERETRSTTIEGQPVGIALVKTLATKDELEAQEVRIVAELKKLEGALNSERSVARVANGNIHARIDKTVEGMAEMKGELHQINANLSRLIDIAMHPKPAR